MQNGGELQLLPGFDTNKKRQEAEMKCRDSALGVTGIRNEDIIRTAVHVKCLEMKPERPDSDSPHGESQGSRMPRSLAAGRRPAGGAKRRFMEVAREDAKSVAVREARTQRIGMRWRLMVGFCLRRRQQL